MLAARRLEMVLGSNPTELWESFHEVLDPVGVPAVKCKGCHHSFKHPSFYKEKPFSTTALSCHQKGCIKLKQASHNASQSSSNILNLFEKQSMVGKEAN